MVGAGMGSAPHLRSLQDLRGAYPLTWVCARDAQRPAHDAARRYPGGSAGACRAGADATGCASAAIAAQRRAGGGRSRITTCRVAGPGRLQLTTIDGRTETVGADSGTGGGADPMAFDHGPHRAVIEDFLDAVRDGRLPAVTGRSALAVQVVIEAIIASSDQGRPVALKPDNA